jgi:hypothetical protein
MTVHIPMNFALSLLKNVSTTTALPIAFGGEMKKLWKARQVAMAAYVWLFAQPTLKTKLPIKDIMKIGRRPYRVESGRQNSGAPPRMAICKEVRYDALWRLTPRSSEISS